MLQCAVTMSSVHPMKKKKEKRCSALIAYKEFREGLTLLDSHSLAVLCTLSDVMWVTWRALLSTGSCSGAETSISILGGRYDQPASLWLKHTGRVVLLYFIICSYLPDRSCFGQKRVWYKTLQNWSLQDFSLNIFLYSSIYPSIYLFIKEKGLP